MTEALQTFSHECDLTDDAFLGGALHILQPKVGYRAGVDAVLLAAAVPVKPGSATCVLDSGAGVGTVGLCVARRCPEAAIVLLEKERVLAEIARDNVQRNGLRDRVTVAEADVNSVSAGEMLSGGLRPESCDHTLANPPFHGERGGTHPSDRLKAGAHAMPEGGLDGWMRFLARMARPGGTATVINKSEALAELLSALDRRFGALRVLPVYARKGEAAIRVIVQGIKGSRAPLILLPGLILHETGGAFTPTAQAILRDGAGLDLAKAG